MKSNLIFRHAIIFWILLVLSCLTNISPAQTKWYKYPGNPVFYPGDEGDWDHYLSTACVRFYDNKYHMWYTAYEKDVTGYGDIGYATSDDLIHWKKYEGNPLKFKCNGTPWDSAYLSVDVIKTDSIFYMWYRGEPKDNMMFGNIGFAWSDDGINWEKLSEPVLYPGKENAWDAQKVGGSRVIYDSREFHMWYVGDANSMTIRRRTGYATSKDGIHWIKHPENPVIDLGRPNAWDAHWAIVNAVNYNGSNFEMWYSGFNGTLHHIGYATSDNGFEWIKYHGNPVLKTGELGTWDASYIFAEEILFRDSVYNMLYSGNDRNIGIHFGYATTSAEEARSWDTAGLKKQQKTIRVQVLNSIEYIKVDSLIQILPKLSGINLVEAYNKLALAFSLNDEEKSLFYSEKALELATKKNYPSGRAMALFCKGNCQFVMDNYGDALINQLKALNLFDSLGMLPEAGNLMSQIASIHSYTGSFELALNYHKRSNEIYEELNDTLAIIKTLENLGYSYLSSGDTLNAINTFHKGLLLSKLKKENWSLALSYGAIGYAYRTSQLDSSINYFKKALNIWDTLNWISVAQIYMNIAEAYYLSGAEYYKDAEIYFLKAYEIYKHEGRERKIRFCYGIAELYFKTKRYSEVRAYLDKSLYMCQSYLAKQNHNMYASLNDKLENEIYLKSYLEKTYKLYFRLDTAINHDVAAWKHLALATQWKDSIYNQQNRRQWAMLQGQYETESAERHIDVLEKENEVKDLRIQQSRIYLFSLGGFVLIIILMALLFVRQNKIRAEHNTVVLEQKLLRLQMNPHFIFNALSNILNFVNRKDTIHAANYLTSFSRLLRTTLESSREDYIVLEDEISSIRNYLDLQLLRYTDKFDYSIKVDDNIDIENSIIPPMLIQPFIENAIEHGMSHKKTKGNIVIRFKLENKMVICEVEDDGIGREKAWEAEYQKRKTHKSLATEIIKDRIQSLNKKLKQKINLSIIDLKSDSDESLGTRVVLRIPYLID